MDSRSADRAEDADSTHRLPWWAEAVLLVAVALALSLVVKTFFVQAFYIPSGSMEPTLRVDDKLLVEKWSYWAGSPRRGDIVVFDDPGGWLPASASAAHGPVQRALQAVGLSAAGGHLVKRVVAVGGDTVSCCDARGRLEVNGAPVDEPYLLSRSANTGVTFSQKVQKGYLWVEGDNRGDSKDSRYHMGDPGGGQVPVSDVVGRAWLRVWPLGRFGFLGGTDAFDDVRSRS